MCTVTWRREGSRLDVFFNRDELRTRPPALPPRLFEIGARRCIAPIDGRAGGTWLAANDAGLVVGILNFYDGQAAPPPPQPCSRGQLVLNQMSLASVDALTRAFPDSDLSVYPAFILIALDSSRGILFHWDGRALRKDLADEALLPITTSSFDTAAVIAARRKRYEQITGSAAPSIEALEQFHADTYPDGGAYAVKMERPDARTVSFSHVCMTDREIEYCYASCDDSRVHRLALPRAAHAT